jgi:hypothetical protein
MAERWSQGAICRCVVAQPAVILQPSRMVGVLIEVTRADVMLLAFAPAAQRRTKNDWV